MSERPEIAPLIERLEKFAENDRELDAAIAAVVLPGHVEWRQTRFTMEAVPIRRYQTRASLSGWASEPVAHYTTSLDAALKLLRRGYRLYALQHQPNHVDDPGHWFAGVANDVAPIVNPPAQSFMAKAKTPAVATCIAALKALAWAEAAPR